MSLARLYRMTIATVWYDQRAEFQREYEMHFKASRRGSIRNVRRALARRGLAHLQREIYRRHHKWVPLRKLKVGFEREEPAKTAQRDVSVETRSMRYRGKHWSATPLASKVIAYAKRRRRTSKRKHVAPSKVMRYATKKRRRDTKSKRAEGR